MYIELMKQTGVIVNAIYTGSEVSKGKKTQFSSRTG